LWTRYITSYYTAFMGIVGETMQPSSDDEKMLATGIELFGACVLGLGATFESVCARVLWASGATLEAVCV
jgi:hypothetical protein